MVFQEVPGVKHLQYHYSYGHKTWQNDDFIYVVVFVIKFIEFAPKVYIFICAWISLTKITHIEVLK